MGLSAIVTIASRELLLYVRNKGRVLGTLGVPFFYLVALGFGLNAVLSVNGTSYFSFLVSGIIAMVIMFQSVFSALSVVTERQFGFLKEILVAPISRNDIVLGKAIGNGITASIQGILVLVIAFLIGFSFSQPWINLVLAVLVMLLLAVGFVGLGLVFASKITDPQTFQILFNFLIMPLFLLSGAMYPVDSAPDWLQKIAYMDPLTYGVDAFRGLLIGMHHLPLWLDVSVLALFGAASILLAAFFFNKSQ